MTMIGVAACAATNAGLAAFAIQCEQHSADHYRLPAHPVAEPAEIDIQRRTDHGHDNQQQVLGLARQAERLFEEHLQVEEGEVPDRTLSAHDAEESDHHAPQVAPFPERLAQGCARDVAFLAQPRELGALRQLRAHPHGNGEKHDRDEERNAPAPCGEGLFADAGARDDDHQQGGEQAERGGGLDPSGRGAALAVGRVLGDVDRRAAIFAAERDALEDSQQDEQRGAGRPGLRVGRDEADQESRSAHQAHGDEERALAAEPVADHAEDQGAERTEREAGREQGQSGDQCRRRLQAGEEDLRNDRRETSENEEVVPFEGRARGRCDDDARHRPGPLKMLLGYCRHVLSPR
jgi:hypothetical protein